MEGYKSIKDCAKEWGISGRRIRALCAQNRIPGAARLSLGWVIPVETSWEELKLGKTESSKRNEIDRYSKEELFDMAFFERVTHYYNWSWMRDKLNNFEQYGIENFVFVHFDVKDFKMVNELYGHEVGDNLLRKICHSMDRCEWSYFSCRCDNDNFAMMIKPKAEEEIRQDLLEFFATMTCLEEDPTYPIFFRCGVAYINNVEDYRVTVTDMAKLAQREGTNVNVTEIHFYTDSMKEEQIKGKRIKSDVSRAMEEKEFLVYYQPKYDPRSDTLVGAEALIRWNLHHEEIIAPGRFVPYLEKENAIEQIDRFVLEEVCIKLEEWKQQGKKLVPISVNMSKTQFYSPVMLQSILNIVDQYDVDRQYIEFELSESMAYHNETYMLYIMRELRSLGFKLSMDDFGTGFSSLNLLSNMPLTSLKIDKSFIDEIEQESGDRVRYIVKDILGMAQHLKIISVAEGVETRGQNELIKSWGCDSVQGYYYSKPLPVKDFERLL